ncbi:MAG: rod shape-determining protein MreC, partial [Haliea sp.]
RRAESAFARIYCEPQARVSGTQHVMVIKPVAMQLPPAADAPAAPAVRRGVQP